MPLAAERAQFVALAEYQTYRTSNRMGVRTVSGKRHMSAILIGLGGIAIGLAIPSGTAGVANLVFAGLGVVALTSGWWLGQASGVQEIGERTDALERQYGSDVRNFRTQVAALWSTLRRYYETYDSPDCADHNFQELVDGAGTPDAPGATAKALARFLSYCLPPARMKAPTAIESIPEGISGVRDNRELVECWTAVKHSLEYWLSELDTNDLGEPLLRNAVLRLRHAHITTLRLMWFLSIAHWDHTELSRPAPSYQHITRLLDLMQSTDDTEAGDHQ